MNTGAVVAVAPHPDDAEWGCGATLSKMSSRGFPTLIVCLTKQPPYRRSEAAAGAKALGAEYIALSLDTDGSLTKRPSSVDRLADVLRGAGTVLCPPATDTHQDHRSAHFLTRAAVRRLPVGLWEYETPSAYDWTPNVWTEVTAEDIVTKTRALAAHGSQADRPYMAPRLTMARAVTSASAIGAAYAEGLRIIRGVL